MYDDFPRARFLQAFDPLARLIDGDAKSSREAGPWGLDEVSVIVPTKNESAWLPRLLQSVRRIFPTGEVVVADFRSTDGTPDLARQYGCEVVMGGRPADGRNAGALASQGSILIFADADCILDRATVLAGLEALRRGADCVHFRTTPITASLLIKVLHRVFYFYVGAAQAVGLIRGIGPVIMVRRSVFEKVNGFDNKIKVGEDAEFLRRVGRIGAVEYVLSNTLFVSSRRFVVENLWLYLLKCLMWATILGLRIRTWPISYRWLDYDTSIAIVEAKILRSLGRSYPSRSYVLEGIAIRTWSFVRRISRRVSFSSGSARRSIAEESQRCI